MSDKMQLVPLRYCRVGLFVHGNNLCVKTEYENEAYIVSSGEYFWGVELKRINK